MGVDLAQVQERAHCPRLEPAAAVEKTHYACRGFRVSCGCLARLKYNRAGSHRKLPLRSPRPTVPASPPAGEQHRSRSSNLYGVA